MAKKRSAEESAPEAETPVDPEAESPHGVAPDRPLDPYRWQPEPTLTPVEVAQMAGMPYEDAKRLNRALGFPDVEDDIAHFNERGAEVLTGLKALHDVGIPFEELISVARVYGQSLAAIADAETRLFQKYLVDPLFEQGRSTSEVEDRLDPVVQQHLETLGNALDFVHRRHLAMALQNLTAGAGPRTEGEESVAIGFVDLVDFSRLVDNLHRSELGEVVDRFEEVVIDATIDQRVRIVKMIGDAAMIASRDPRILVEAAFGVIETVVGDQNLPQARVGIDFGDAVPLAGDYFGRPVNVAARIVGFANPGTTVVSESLLEELGKDSVQYSRIGTQRLKGVGRVKLYKINGLEPGKDPS